MLETYKAVLQGNKIEWETDAPKILENKKRVEVFITILSEEAVDSHLRPFGLNAGEFVAPNDFDAPLPAEIVASFER